MLLSLAGRATAAASSSGSLALLSACGLRRADSEAAAGDVKERPRSTDPEVRRAAACTAPTTLPELPARSSSRSLLPLCSINDPDNWGLGVSPQGSGEPQYYWQGSSISNPKETVVTISCAPRASALSPLPVQGFRTAQTRPKVQRVVFRSSMLDPDHPALVIHPPGSPHHD